MRILGLSISGKVGSVVRSVLEHFLQSKRQNAALCILHNKEGSTYSSDSTPNLGTSICQECGPKKRQKKNQTNKQKNTQQPPSPQKKMKEAQISLGSRDNLSHSWEYCSAV